MALFLTDEELDALAEKAQKVLNAPTKKDAVRQALERVVENDASQTERLHLRRGHLKND
jgi:antitoxin VapB